ncbi:MAG: hypothetical protein ISN28_02990 [Ectothiorhodospiraceae bacterium AqS1]|nr:hypothetical protein [Ectothiorhodospiraceae bacterium AqS1]
MCLSVCAKKHGFDNNERLHCTYSGKGEAGAARLGFAPYDDGFVTSLGRSGIDG